MDRDQLVQDLLNERSFSSEKSPVTGYFVELTRGDSLPNRSADTWVGEMRTIGAHFEGISEADMRAEAEKIADMYLAEYGG